jgi:2'-5' RNA ligase
MIRAFIAVGLSPELRSAIAASQRAVKDQLTKAMQRQAPDVRIQWVRPEAMHVTLKFLGNVVEDGLQDIERAMQQVADGHAPFTLEVGGLGVFPDVRAPRVLWIGLSGTVEQLIGLAGDLDAALQELGFAPEPRPFQPHLTLARIKERSRDVGRVLAGSGLFEQVSTVGKLAVPALSLMKSDLKPSGAVYTKLFEAPLRGPPR